MSVRKEPSGRRSVSVEVEVPGTPEQVWEAIATGPGITAWFLPTEFREDGTVATTFAPGMDSVAQVTEWDPPRRFQADGEEIAPGAPPVGTEWIVEARDGGTCIVRVVHSLFTSRDDWDDQLESFESGWPWYFRILKAYLQHFRGLPSASFRVISFSPLEQEEAWGRLSASLGLEHARTGQPWQSDAPGVRLRGTIEGDGSQLEARGGSTLAHAVMVRLEEPGTGTAGFFSHRHGGRTWVVGDLYLYGEGAPEAVERTRPALQAWLDSVLPSAGP